MLCSTLLDLENKLRMLEDSFARVKYVALISANEWHKSQNRLVTTIQDNLDLKAILLNCNTRI